MSELTELRKEVEEFRNAKELHILQTKVWQRKNPEKVNAYSKKWREENPEKYQASMKRAALIRKIQRWKKRLEEKN